MPAESYDDDEDEIEGPKSSFGTYLAEGDALFKQSEFKKALASYSLVRFLDFDCWLLILEQQSGKTNHFESHHLSPRLQKN